MIGTVLDDTYRVLERIGAGGMGEVFLVEHLHIGRREAIKVLRPEMASDLRLASRFRREARAINRLRHPNIIGIYDFGQLPDGRLYLTMEYAQGESLADVLRREGRVELSRALHVLEQLANAIDHAHDAGVVHRDLKPANLVLVDDRGKLDSLKILDFGFAKVITGDAGDKLTLLGELFGTPEYMAPERMGTGPDDPRSDLYSIGCIGYELLVGRPPFTGSRGTVMAAHIQTQPQSPARLVPGIPPMLDSIIMQLLSKDPAHRLQNGKQLAVAISQVPGAGKRKTAWRTAATPLSTTLVEGKRPAQMAYADTASASTDEVRDEIFNSLVDLAATTITQCPGDDQLAVALAVVHAVRDDRLRFTADRTELDRRSAHAQQTAREREGSLRFAIAELRFERQKPDASANPALLADLDYQIGALKARVSELALELQAELHRIDERGIELAAQEHDLQMRWIELHRRLKHALDARLRALGPHAGVIAGRFAVVGAAVDEMLALSR